MTRAAPQPQRRRWWHYLTQFSLRSLLVVVTLVAVGCWWFLMPESRDEELAGKYLKLRRDVRVNTVVAARLPEDDDRRFVSHGAWRVRDQHGDLLIDGHYSGNERHGKWTLYHVTGRKAAEGIVFRGVRSGVWRTWDEEGQLRSEVTYQAVERFGKKTPAPRPLVNTLTPLLGMIDLPLAQFGGGGMMGGGTPAFPPPLPGFESFRHGPAKRWYASGPLQFEGAYQDDLREGPWTFYDEQGRSTARGNYRAGIREGAWQITNAGSPQPLTREYQVGLPKDELAALIAALGRQLAGGSTNGKLAAAQLLEQIGAPAVPCLLQALASSDPEVQLLALRALTRLKSLPEQALPKVVALSDHSDPHLALRAKLAVYLAAPAERSRLFPELMPSLQTAGDELAIEALLAMYRADSERPLALLAPLIERMGRAKAESPRTYYRTMHDTSQIADLGWDVIPQLAAIYPQASSEAREFSVLVLMDLVGRDGADRVEESPGVFVVRWEISELAQPLLSQALADADPRVKEAAEMVGKRRWPQTEFGGGGGLGGGFF